MKLRELIMEDAEFMLEWMKDDSVVCDLHTDFLKMTVDDCKKFIGQAKKQYSEKNPYYLHYAITDENSKDFDEYLGTVSLKNINYSCGQAEFAIVIRCKAMHKGLAYKAMQKITSIGFEQLGLISIYWYVSLENVRANRFYEKNGYKGLTYKDFYLRYGKNQQRGIVDADPAQYIWYFISRNDD